MRPAGNYSLAELAARLNLSTRHLTRLFREEVGTTPAGYVESIRFDIASLEAWPAARRGVVMGRVWLVTGASSGFGRASSEAALAAGDVVVGAARPTEAPQGLVAARPGRMEALRLDVTDTSPARGRYGM